MRRGEASGSNSNYARWYQRHKDEPGFREKNNAQKRAARAALSPVERKERDARRGGRTAEQRRRDTDSMSRSMDRRHAFLDSLKTGPCTDCGKRHSPHIMDFDHRPGVHKERTKSRLNTVSYLIVSAPIPRVLAEIKKCDLVCSNCHRERTHRRLVAQSVVRVDPSAQYQAHQRRRELIWSMKRVPCADCNVRYEPYIMDFDHRPGVEKVGAVSTLQVSRKRLLEEIAKCDVVCSNCHRERTHRRRVSDKFSRGTLLPGGQHRRGQDQDRLQLVRGAPADR